jgi:sugar/nucleoside kinase (ribokinase family)
MNEAELRQFTGTYSLHGAAHQVLALGPQAVVVKRGEYGAALFCLDDCFTISAYPLTEVKDPTGAGDAFAGGFLGYLVQMGKSTPDHLRCAVVHGCVIASFTVEDFSVNRLRRLTWQEIEGRFQEFRRFTYFE